MLHRVEALAIENLQPTHLDLVKEVLQQNKNRLFVAGPYSYFSPDLTNYPIGTSLSTIERDIHGRPTGLNETFYVAPLNHTFNPKRSEKLRKDIEKSLTPTLRLNSFEPKKVFNRTSYGILNCVDKLATQSTKTIYSVIEIEPGALAKSGITPGETSTSGFNDIFRRITIIFVPHPVLALILRNEVPKRYFDSDKQHIEDLTRGISELQLQKLKSLLHEQFPDPKHILYELINVAIREEMSRQLKEIQRVRGIIGE
jgi:hypothetical protein